jgi:hypothetical protein
MSKKLQRKLLILIRTGEKDESRDYEKGGKEPMNPEDIASHEPTAVKRDKNKGSSGDPV